MANTGTPDPKRVELMSSPLLKHAPSDIAIFYNSASEDERRAMGGISVSRPRADEDVIGPAVEDASRS